MSDCPHLGGRRRAQENSEMRVVGARAHVAGDDKIRIATKIPEHNYVTP